MRSATRCKYVAMMVPDGGMSYVNHPVSVVRPFSALSTSRCLRFEAPVHLCALYPTYFLSRWISSAGRISSDTHRETKRYRSTYVETADNRIACNLSKPVFLF